MLGNSGSNKRTKLLSGLGLISRQGVKGIVGIETKRTGTVFVG